MRAILVLVLSGLILTGCKHPKTGDAEKTSREKSTGKSKATQAVPVNEPSGKVASVNANLRFVVIDFAFNAVPKVDQAMNVYRQGQKVGEVKISSQSRNNIIAADITAGEARVGDEVRP